MFYLLKYNKNISNDAKEFKEKISNPYKYGKRKNNNNEKRLKKKIRK